MPIDPKKRLTHVKQLITLMEDNYVLIYGLLLTLPYDLARRIVKKEKMPSAIEAVKWGNQSCKELNMETLDIY